MKRLAAFAALAAAATLPAVAVARDTYVQDQANMFSKSAIAQTDQRIATFNRATGKEVVVVTVPSLQGQALQAAAQQAFAQQNVDGVLIYIARDDRRDIIVPDRSGVQAGWFTPDVLQSIRQNMESAFRSEAFDSGLLSGVDGVLAVYGRHMQARPGAGAPNGQLVQSQSSRAPAVTGIHISTFWWIVIIVVGFLILRSVMRAASGPRYYGPPGSPGAPGAPGGPGGPGYGAGYGGYGGGGGSFWSGLLGGLGGAWLGNEMFGNRGGGAASGGILPGATGQAPDAGGSWGGGAADSGGFQSDAGQADMGGASAGDWSGGGFGGDAGGGGGDFGGGGGGGDSGGGW